MDKDLKQRKSELEIKKIERVVSNYLRKNIDNLVYADVHHTSLKYYFENNKDKFIKSFIEVFRMDIFFSFKNKGELVFPISGSCMCFNCGKEMELVFDGKTIYNKYNNKTCFDEKVYSVDIDIPSGKLLLVDWPLYGKKILDIKEEDVNCLLGRYKQSKNYEEHNVMHFFVGNTCPTVEQKGDSVIVEQLGWTRTEERVLYGNGYEEKGWVCTDLWWVTGIDVEHYKNLLIEKMGKLAVDGEVLDFINNHTVVEVAPGKYRCTSYYEICDEDSEKAQIFIQIEKI